MLILAFSTSTDHGSVAVARNGEILGSSQWTRTAHGSEMLVQKIKGLLSKLKIKAASLDGIAVDRGPGSFTGCRIAANVARTMAFSLDLKIIPISSLDTMAESVAALHVGKILAILDAHKSLLFARWFVSDGKSIVENLSPIGTTDLTALKPSLDPSVLVVGEIPSAFVELLREMKTLRPLRENFNFPQAKIMAKHASHLSPENFVDWKEIEPIYIRAPEAVERFENFNSPVKPEDTSKVQSRAVSSS